MLSENRSLRNILASLPLRYGIAAISWLIIISLLHYQLNFSHEKRIVLRMGYMPVITNLAAPLLDQASINTGDYRFKAIKFSSFAEMAEALRNDHIDVAFIIAPLAIVLKQQGENVKIVYIGNRNESTIVVRKDLDIKQFSDLSGKTLAVPMRYSGHYLEILEQEHKTATNPAINIVEMNPPDMAVALATGTLDAYFVGEPFAAQAIIAEDAKVLNYVEDLCPHFICNLVLVKQKLINQRYQAVQHLVTAAVRSGLWAARHPDKASRVASRYWNQPQQVVKFALTTPDSRIEYGKYTPEPSEIQRIADLMVRYKLLSNSDIDGLVDQSFANSVSLEHISDLKSILQTD